MGRLVSMKAEKDDRPNCRRVESCDALWSKKGFKTHESKGKELGRMKQKRCFSWVRRLNIAATLEGYECPIPGHHCSLPVNGCNPACCTPFSLPGTEPFPVCISIFSKSKGERMEMLSLLGVCYEYFSGFCIHPWNAHGLQR